MCEDPYCITKVKAFTPKKSLRSVMAARDLRLGHFLWHETRDWWLRLPPNQRTRFATKYGWVPPRPARDERGQPIWGSGTGIDFLGAHRAMLQEARVIVAVTGEPPLLGWDSLPSASDTRHRVDRGVSFPSSLFPGKDDRTWTQLVEETEELLTPGRLKDITLDELGTTIEFGIHNAMHERWGGLSSDGRLRSRMAVLSDQIDSQWDNEQYDTLLDAYSAHVNPLFWMIHGWVDRCIVRWEAANRERAALSSAWLGPMADHGM